jgi:hypothetical protein
MPWNPKDKASSHLSSSRAVRKDREETIHGQKKEGKKEMVELKG